MSSEMDESSVLALMRFAKFSETSWNPKSISQLTMGPELIPEPDSEASGLDLYFELLHLQPFVIGRSFECQESVDISERTFDSCNPLYFLVNEVTMAIGSISGAPLTLNQLKVENAQMSQGHLITRLIQHYPNNWMSQLYRVITSADFLGNLAGLFNSVSSGVQDLFYEPLNGVILHGTSKLGVGIARGAASLVKKVPLGSQTAFKKLPAPIVKRLTLTGPRKDIAAEF
ncbi:hypothetical protein O181_013332 [Austropuccinia psidii MF-1]|uniref:Vacuolar protein sorting-associated protein 13 DH-like domain-containing protein n=1 Tax=Austropuccinia psidii MF-1 TaxID=1389203 RepID=A0A9Q3BY41_9BASI|nr:hypothetical protein [Austropuccinia psidii MF-1]